MVFFWMMTVARPQLMGNLRSSSVCHCLDASGLVTLMK